MPETLTLTPPQLPKRPPRRTYHTATLAPASDALRQFPDFAAQVWIESKELGRTPIHLWGTQRYVLEEIQRGIGDGLRTFYVLKGRQQGISTSNLALDLYWMIRHPGMQGELITDTDDNRTLFKDTLDAMWRHLPRAYSCPRKAHNRAMFSFVNGSRLLYQVAGTRSADTKKASPIGQSRGLNFLHATECGSWADEEQLERLSASLAERHPHRLYVFESTARGYNLWYDMWQDAQHAISIRPIFVGWWRKELNRVEPGSPAYETYWDGKWTGDERIKAKVIQKRYGVDLQPAQVAWWRYTHAEHIKNPATMFQEHPWLPDDAFQAAGDQFISGGRLNLLREQAKQANRPEWYAYTFGATFDTTALDEAQPGHGALRVWEEPIPGALYVLGADPAYGSSDASDRYVASLWRVDGGKLVQVAEYVTPLGASYQFAWVLMHLCGAYGGDVLLILELSGPGVAVWDEVQRLTLYGWGLSAPNYRLMDVFGGIRHYLYRRSDAIHPNLVYQWKTTGPSQKVPLMNKFRDTVERGALLVRSKELADECQSIRQAGDVIEAHGRAKDDRVVAAALAVEGWLTMLIPDLGLTEPGEQPPPADPLGRRVVDFLRDLRKPPAEED